MRRLGAQLIVLVLLAVGSPAQADNVEGADEIIVAVVDTGLDATHPEFVAGQVVAWWDFTSEAKPASRTDPFAQGSPTWDPDIAQPFDGAGHGTAVASVVGGRNAGSCGGTPKESHAPGVKLAIAKVGTSSGAIEGDLALAFRWATEVVHADVISLSIGAVVPTPLLADSGYDALRDARAAGVLPVVLAHNGLANAGLAPFPSETNFYSSSPHTFVVGGGSRAGNTLTSTMGNDDPDVSAWSDSVCVARANTGGYALQSGTSFATPLVAGMAATAMKLAVQNGHDASPDAISDILRRCARDTVAPYAREGWGFLGAPEQPCIRAHAANGTTPTYVSFTGLPVNENELYDDNVRAPLRQVASGETVIDVPTSTFLARTTIPVASAQGEIGASLPAGIAEVEAYRFHVAAGQTLEIGVATLAAPTGGRPGLPDLDLALHALTDHASGTFASDQALARSIRPAGSVERIAWTAPADMDVVLLVVGVSIAAPAPFTVSANLPPTFLDEAYYAGSGLVLA